MYNIKISKKFAIKAVYLNGKKLIKNKDYTINLNNLTITFLKPPEYNCKINYDLENG